MPLPSRAPVRRSGPAGRLSRRVGLAGFTLIELLVVVLIIGILSAMSIPQYFRVVEMVRVSEVKSFVGVVRSAQERYAAQNGAYSSLIASLDISFPDCQKNGDACGLKSFRLTTMEANAASCPGGGPGYVITVTRNNTGVAERYGAYTVKYDRCLDALNFGACANCVADGF